MILEVKRKRCETFLAQLSFVAKAMSTDPLRFVLQHVLIDGDTMAATDGRRLHYCTMGTDRPGGIKDGLWRVLKLGAVAWLDRNEESLSYPKWRDVIPDTTLCACVAFPDGIPGICDLPWQIMNALTRATNGGTFNSGYVADAMPMRFSTKTEVYGTDSTSAALLVHDLGSAVLMPMRVSDLKTVWTAKPVQVQAAAPTNTPEQVTP